MNPDPFIDAKEIETIVRMSPRHIRRADTQRRLGINSARDKTCDRPIRWHRKPAVEALRKRNFTVEEIEES